MTGAPAAVGKQAVRLARMVVRMGRDLGQHELTPGRNGPLMRLPALVDGARVAHAEGTCLEEKT
jgi:hypothetical protein